jgi:hypothetical protein
MPSFCQDLDLLAMHLVQQGVFPQDEAMDLQWYAENLGFLLIVNICR